MAKIDQDQIQRMLAIQQSLKETNKDIPLDDETQAALAVAFYNLPITLNHYDYRDLLIGYFADKSPDKSGAHTLETIRVTQLAVSQLTKLIEYFVTYTNTPENKSKDKVLSDVRNLESSITTNLRRGEYTEVFESMRSIISIGELIQLTWMTTENLALSYNDPKEIEKDQLRFAKALQECEATTRWLYLQRNGSAYS